MGCHPQTRNKLEALSAIMTPFQTVRLEFVLCTKICLQQRESFLIQNCKWSCEKAAVERKSPRYLWIGLIF